MNMTDAQVLEQLKLRKIRLKIELERVELAIRAFEKIKTIDPLDYAAYDADDMELEADEDLSIGILLYNPGLSVEKKIYYALGQIGKGTAKEITAYLIRVDGHIKNAKEFHERITYLTSRLFRLNQLDADRDGKRNVYRLKK
jgi:hypothetical protein